MHLWLVFVFFPEYNPAERGKANRITGNKGALKKERKKKGKIKLKWERHNSPSSLFCSLTRPWFRWRRLGWCCWWGWRRWWRRAPSCTDCKRKESGVNSCLACCVSEPGQPQMFLTYVFVHFRHNLAGRKRYSSLSFLTYFIHNPRDITCDSCEHSVGGRQTSLFAKANSTVQIPRVTLFTHKWTSTIATATSWIAFLSFPST